MSTSVLGSGGGSGGSVATPKRAAVLASALGARRKRQAELLEQRRQAAQALKAERAEAMAADESRQRAEDGAARKAAQAAAQAATEVAGEEWKAAEQAKRERKLAAAQVAAVSRSAWDVPCQTSRSAAATRPPVRQRALRALAASFPGPASCWLSRSFLPHQ